MGSVHVITYENSTQAQLNEYDPWGGVSKSVGNIDPTHRFNGQELDPESGLYYYGGRYYDQEISRFVSPDPFVQSPDDPQNLNRYSYVFNNPQGYIDPSGYEGEASGGSYIPLYQWVKFFMDLFASDDDKERPKRHKTVPVSNHDITVKNGPGTPKNVSVYDSDPYRRLQPEDYPEEPLWKRILDSVVSDALAAGSDEGGPPKVIGRRTPLRRPGSPVGPTDYVSLPNGRVIPIPQGWAGRVADNGQGVVYQKPGSTGDANSVRIMDPNRHNPHGYVKLTDSKGNSLDVNGAIVSPNSPAAHIPQNYQGQIPALWKLHGRTP